jgi:biopolymer transport protein ExbD
MHIRRTKRDFFIPTNAMSDVAFLLLIFIMLVSLINYRKTVAIDYPEAQSAEKVSVEKNLEIWVDKGGNIYLNGTPSSIKEVENGIISAYQKAPDTRVHVIADKNTPFKNVNKVLDILQVLQYQVVSFVVKE